MSRTKVNNETIYQELDKLASLYYSHCSVKDILKYLSDLTSLSVILTSSSFEVLSAYFWEDQLANLAYDRILPLYTAPGESNIIPFKINGRLTNFLAMSLPDRSNYLCIEASFEHSDKYRKLILKNSLPFLSLLLEKANLEPFGHSANRYRPLFRILREDTSRLPEEVRQIASLYHIDTDLKRVCMTIQPQETMTLAEIKQLSQRIRGFIEDRRSFVASREDLIVVLLFYPQELQDLDAITQSYMLAIALFDFLSGQYSLRIGISTAHKGPETMHVAYNESIQSIKVQKQLGLSNTASSYFEQSIFHILNTPQLANFQKLALDIIEPLLSYDAANGTNYYEILKQYFRNNFNIQKTAKALYIHRNTLTYRLQHLTELLKFDFDFENNTDALFTLYLCICVHELGYRADDPRTPGMP